MSFFRVEHLCARYGRTPILHDLSFSLKQGQLLGILGANGCGKTTLLKALCGILPHQGHCFLGETCLEPLSPRQLAALCSYIPQRSGIGIDISLLDVVLMGFNPQLGLLERPTGPMRERARQALAQVGLAGREEENYLHLSEGQKQLCILARTLAADSRLLLLDEPESALDFHHRHELLRLLRQWISAGERGGIVTLHDPTLALNHCDALLVLHQGTILGRLAPETDPPEQMEELLSTIYGPLQLQVCQTRSGKTQRILLKEDVL